MKAIAHLRDSLFRFGETIPNLTIHGKPAPYPVLNERVIRAGAGVMFVMAFFSFMQALYLREFVFLKFTVSFSFLNFS